MIYNTKDAWQGKSFQLYGEYGESEISVFRRLVKDGQFVLDIGANIGSFTVPLAHLVGRKGAVLAFEPERQGYHNLCGAVALNNLPNVYCVQHAVGKENGQILVPELDPDIVTNFGGVSLKTDYGDTPMYNVPLTTIDKVIGDKPCHFMKIDVEGMELDVIEGAVNTIRNHRPILYVDDYVEPGESNKLKSVIQGLGYKYYTHIAPIFNPQNYYEVKVNEFILNGATVVSINLICLPEEIKCPFTPDELSAMAGHPPQPRPFLGQNSCSVEMRTRNGDYEKYLKGYGIDIGGGTDPLATPFGSVRNWDMPDGDAKDMAGVPDKCYDFVYSSHCLEHLTDMDTALKNWCRILKPGGVLFVCVPDWTLYEHHQWPSRFNSDHKFTFSLTATRDEVKRNNHYNIQKDLVPILDRNGVEVLELRLEDDRYDYTLSDDIDQTAHLNAVAQVCIIGRKRA